jgi:DnaJ-class molecular chaperone
MAADDCTTCNGKGEIQELRKLGADKVTDSAWVKCRDCGGTGKRKR